MTEETKATCLHMNPRESLLRIGLGYPGNDVSQPPMCAYVVCRGCDFTAWFWGDGDYEQVRQLETEKRYLEATVKVLREALQDAMRGIDESAWLDSVRAALALTGSGSNEVKGE